MSGIETVGLVLGLWPVVKNITELYKASKDGFAVRNLGINIATQEIIFKQSILKLLQGDEELTDKDRVGLINGDKDFADIWKDPAFKARLEKRLDPQVFLVLQHNMEEISRLLTSLKTKIEPKEGGLAPIGPSATWSTVGSSGSNSERRHLPRVNVKAMKLVLHKDEIKADLNHLKSCVDSLRTLLEPASFIAYSRKEEQKQQKQQQQQQQQPSRKPAHGRTDSEELRRKRNDAQFFDDFYQVLCQSFHCQCGVAHECNLKISDSLEVVFPVEEVSRAMSELHMRARSMTLDSQVTTGPPDFEDTDISSEIVRSTWSPMSQKESVSSTASEYQALLLIFNQSRGVQKLSHIEDLCQWLKTMRTSPPNTPPPGYQGVLGQNGKRYTVNAPRAQHPLGSPTVVSMDDYLSSCESQKMLRRIRFELALNLASAIVRFYPTSWMDIAWTWRNFSMMKGETTQLCITKRIWSLETSRQSTATPPTLSRFWRTLRFKDPMLVRLGFALIELAMGKRLADIRSEMYGGAGGAEPEIEAMRDMEDYNTAMDLVEQNRIRDEVGVVYQTVVKACLHCKVLDDDGMKPLKSDSATFEDDVERFIIGPLRQFNLNTFGQIAVY